MSKAKYVVVSGFLGAGKTTSMIALAKSADRRCGKGAILTDDLGAGNVVDADFTATSGVLTANISGDCICYQHENLVDKLHQLCVGGADIIFSDIPGCGIGALDNVYLQLNQREPGEFTLMPFTCIVDPNRLRMIMPEGASLNLPAELKFLLDAQMAEADLIVLNKIDTLTPEGIRERVDFIQNRHPHAHVMTMSARTGEGVDEVLDYLVSNEAPAQHRDIGYGSQEFMAAEKLLCWYNRRVFLEERNDRAVDFNEVIGCVFEEIRAGLRAAGGNVPHLKAFASGGEGDYVKLSLLGVDCDLEYASRLTGSYSAISVIINARAAAESQTMADIVDDALDAVCRKYGLKARTFFVETFGMMEEGKGNGGRASKY